MGQKPSYQHFNDDAPPASSAHPSSNPPPPAPSSSPPLPSSQPPPPVSPPPSSSLPPTNAILPPSSSAPPPSLAPPASSIPPTSSNRTPSSFPITSSPSYPSSLPLSTPFSNPYGYQPTFTPSLHHPFKNSSTTKQKIFISRSCFGSFLKREFSESLTFGRVTKKEFDHEIDSIEKVASHFICSKILYFLSFLLILLSLIFFIAGGVIGGKLNPSESEIIMKKLFLGGALGLFGFGLGCYLMVIFNLKDLEFKVGNYLDRVNQNRFMARGVCWKIGGFCRYVEIGMLESSVELHWYLMTNEGRTIISKNIMHKIKVNG